MMVPIITGENIAMEGRRVEKGVEPVLDHSTKFDDWGIWTEAKGLSVNGNEVTVHVLLSDLK
jgi:hypothetical protein